MKALLFSEAKGLRLEHDYPKPVPSESEALIKVRRAGAAPHQRQLSLCMYESSRADSDNATLHIDI